MSVESLGFGKIHGKFWNKPHNPRLDFPSIMIATGKSGSGRNSALQAVCQEAILKNHPVIFISGELQVSEAYNFLRFTEIHKSSMDFHCIDPTKIDERNEHWWKPAISILDLLHGGGILYAGLTQVIPEKPANKAVEAKFIRSFLAELAAAIKSYAEETGKPALIVFDTTFGHGAIAEIFCEDNSKILNMALTNSRVGKTSFIFNESHLEAIPQSIVDSSNVQLVVGGYSYSTKGKISTFPNISPESCSHEGLGVGEFAKDGAQAIKITLPFHISYNDGSYLERRNILDHHLDYQHLMAVARQAGLGSPKEPIQRRRM